MTKHRPTRYMARQFSRPSGPVGRLVAWALARGNAGFNRWLVAELTTEMPSPQTVIELGCGPGIALEQLTNAYPEARIFGLDPSTVVLDSARKRNAETIATGRLQLVVGDIRQASDLARADLVVACHVVYFWSDPLDELRRIHACLAPDGYLALGYQLRQHMPPVSQRNFPREGFTLYDADDELAAILERAGFTHPRIRTFGDRHRPAGRLALTRPRPPSAKSSSPQPRTVR